ncbi:MAG TPA: choice-of-anchor Q domain-containing protein, partial [Anaerolineales bacterium]|nr:choice-of-anchor Q domain-containing protein [Anaerolineales bacterium]
GNEAANNGGGMYNNFESQPVITNATFETNQALLGGGVYNDNSNASFDTVTFFKNTTLFNGGGMYNINSSPSLVNITFSQNGASGTGGGMHNSNSHPTLTNVTFSENGGLFGAGMYNTSDSSPKLVNTLIANSIGSADCFNSSTSLDPGSSNNLIENSDNACGLVNGVNGNIIGSDPNLGLLQNNGGSTQTHALLAGSPAIDAGTSTGCPATDQRGIHRPLNGDSFSGIKCDIGSFETFPATPVFSDVPANHWAVSFIERLYAFGITGGCSTTPLSYCPDNQVTRAQMAIFLEKGIHSPFFTPANVFPTFTDTVGHFAEDWIEALKNDGVTSGCGAGIYCPENPVTRAQMAIFLLKAKHGASFSPPPATGTFADVPTSHFAAAFIEQLAAEGITSGCAVGLYCPENAVTRDQMAVFLVKAFDLP